MAGKERLRVEPARLYRGAVAVLLVYDIAKDVTFHNCKTWLKELRKNADPDIVIMLVGNKKENLLEERRQVSFDSAEKWARRHGLLFAEPSSGNTNMKRGRSIPRSVEYIFEHLIQESHSRLVIFQPSRIRALKNGDRSTSVSPPHPVCPWHTEDTRSTVGHTESEAAPHPDCVGLTHSHKMPPLEPGAEPLPTDEIFELWATALEGRTGRGEQEDVCADLLAGSEDVVGAIRLLFWRVLDGNDEQITVALRLLAKFIFFKKSRTVFDEVKMRCASGSDIVMRQKLEALMRTGNAIQKTLALRVLKYLEDTNSTTSSAPLLTTDEKYDVCSTTAALQLTRSTRGESEAHEQAALASEDPEAYAELDDKHSTITEFEAAPPSSPLPLVAGRTGELPEEVPTVCENLEDNDDHLYKVVLVGDATAGKGLLLHRYIKTCFPKRTPTAMIGEEFATKTLPLASGGKVKAQFWNTSGMERDRAETQSRYRHAVGALLVYDIADNATFQNCAKWLEELRNNADPNIVIMLVGNKVDLAEGILPAERRQRQVSFDSAKEWAQQHDLLFAEPASNGANTYNVDYIFEGFERQIQEIQESVRSIFEEFEAAPPSSPLPLVAGRTGELPEGVPTVRENLEDNDDQHLYKVVLVGDATAGKGHLLCQYLKGSVPKTPTGTIGREFGTRTVSLAGGGTVKAQFWNTSGMERYRTVTSAHYRRAVGAFLVYDIADTATFQNCAKWLEELRQNAEPNVVIMLVGNTVDLAEGILPEKRRKRQIAFGSAKEWARQHGLLFAEPSSPQDEISYDVKYIFEHLIQEIYNHQSSQSRGVENGGRSTDVSLETKKKSSNVGGGEQSCSIS